MWQDWQQHNGRAVQVDSINPKKKAPGTECSKVKYDALLSTFAFKFNLRRCTTEGVQQRRRR